MSAGDGAVAYEVTGDGPGVVLAHGIAESRRTWDPLIEPLAARHTVVALDLPGHGESPPSGSYDFATLGRAVAAVVAAAGLDRPLLVGHSLGGLAATVAAGAVAARGVVNVDQTLNLSALKSAFAPLEPALRAGVASFRDVIAELFGRLAGALKEGERARIDALRDPRQDVVLAIWAPLFDWSAAELDASVHEIGRRVAVPYLSLHGIDPGDGYDAWLSDVIGGATVEVWPRLGHYPHLADPERFLARLRAFDASAA